jgi:hypothetical protein
VHCEPGGLVLAGDARQGASDGEHELEFTDDPSTA